MTPALRVEPVETPAHVEAFIRFPFELYRPYPRWVPPLLLERRDFLNPRRNPVYEYAHVQPFIARADGRVVGTVVAVRNDRYGQFHPDETHVGFFGLYECVDDPEVSRALLETAAAWLREQGKTVMRGPANLTTNDVLGLVVDGFDDEPAVMMPYNPPYYADQFESFGLSKVKDLFALEMTSADWTGQLDKVVVKLIARGPCTIRPLNRSRWREELEFVRHCYNEAWAGNWGFVPWTDRELEFIAKELKRLVDPRLTFFAEVGGEPAGISISIPDANEALKLARGRLFPLGLLKVIWKLKVAGCRRLRTAVLGVLPAYRRKGVEAILIQRTIRDGLALGYTRAELGWILEDNEPMLRPLQKLGARRTKVFRVYDRAL
jgi:GNAT superfamily N-acetyltransferase